MSSPSRALILGHNASSMFSPQLVAQKPSMAILSIDCEMKPNRTPSQDVHKFFHSMNLDSEAPQRLPSPQLMFNSPTSPHRRSRRPCFFPDDSTLNQTSAKHGLSFSPIETHATMPVIKTEHIEPSGRRGRKEKGGKKTLIQSSFDVEGEFEVIEFVAPERWHKRVEHNRMMGSMGPAM
eukprot:1518609-Rhodomonas_salina.2